MTLWTAADGGGVGGMWTPAYPGELPENRENTNSVPPGGGTPWAEKAGVDEFNWFYGNGQFHISEDHELDELSSHAGVRADHTGPVAMGTVHVDMGKATWNVNGNVSAHGVARILKDYTENAGWQWGGMTDTSGEPVDTGSEFAPKKSYYFEYDGKEAKLARRKSALNFCSGAVHIGGKEGFLYTTEEGAMDALAEWARDTGIVLIANFNRPSIQSMNPQVPPDYDVEGGQVKFQPWAEGNRGKGVKIDGRWYAWNTDVGEYPHHGHAEEAMGRDSSDWTYIHPDGQMTKTHGGWVAPYDERDWDWHTSGNDSGLKRIEDLEIDNNGGIFQNPDEHMEQDPPDWRQPGGVFKCPACSRLFPTWGLYLRHRTQEEPMGENHDDPTKDTAWLDMDAAFPPHYDEMPSFHESAFWNRHPRVNPWDEQDVGMTKGFVWPDGRVESWQTNAMGEPYHLDKLDELNAHDAVGWRQELGQEPEIYETVAPRVEQAVRKHLSATAPEGKDLVQAPVPFIYDIQEDSITVGEPGTRHSAIPGQFTPGGIVEGTYEPGGNVHIRSMTNMPYTVRHMLELWYFNYPHMEIKSVDLTDDEGKQTKLAGHKLWWKPGAWGRGLVAPDGSIHTWPEEEGEHTPMAQIKGLNPEDCTMFHIGPKGDVSAGAQAYGYKPYLTDEENDELVNQVQPVIQKTAGKDVGGYIKSLVAADPATFHAWKALEAAGGKVFVVGGAVRDALLGKTPNDLDLMVTGVPADDVRKIMAELAREHGGRNDITGKDFGVFRYKEGQHEVEIALPRKERSTGEGHKDFMVDTDHNMTPEEDLYRRDFTINAMAVDLSTGQLIDPFGGLADTQSRTLRTLHTKSLADDPLRTMRALTAVAKHGVIPNSETEDQIIENGPLLQHLPADRIKTELDKMFGYDDKGNHKDVDTAKAMRLAMDTGLMQHMIPEVYATQDYDQRNPHHQQLLDQHLLSVLENVQKKAPNDPDLKLAGLLHDIGKPASRWSECRECFHAHPGEVHVCQNCGSSDVSGHFYQKAPGIGGAHESIGAEMAAARMKELRYPNDRIKRVSELIQHHMFPAFNTEKGARRFLNKVGDHADDLLTLRWADQGGKSAYPTDPSISVDDHQELINTVRAGNAPTQLSQLAINGRDLIAAGIPQGPQIGQTLQFLQEQVLENPQLNTKEALLGLIRGRTGKVAWRDEVEDQYWRDEDARAEHPERDEYQMRFHQNYGEFPQTHPEGHRLNWTPGNWGKGTMDHQGNFHTWNMQGGYSDGDPIHEHYEKAVTGSSSWEDERGDAYERRFHIHPNGFVGHYGTYEQQTMPFKRADELHALDPELHGDSRVSPMGMHEEEEYDWNAE